MDGDWTSKEVEEYKRIRTKELGPFYLEQGMPIDKPERRLNYLAEKVLNISKEDIESIKKIVDVNNKPIFLKFLEEITIERFY